MAQIIRSGNDLDKFLESVASKMLTKTRDKVHEAIKKSIEEYYAEYTPTIYKRSERFLNSLVKTEIVKKKNELWCEVKIKEDYLSYAYPYTGKFSPSYPHEYDGRFAMGIDVVNWANRKFPDDGEPGHNHGYTVEAGRKEGFWDAAMDELQDILAILRKNLKDQGIRVV